MNSFCLYHDTSQILREVKFKMFSLTFSIFCHNSDFFYTLENLNFSKLQLLGKKDKIQNIGIELIEFYQFI